MKVLIAVDTSECAEKAFNWYFSHCHKAENEIFVVHEVEQPKLPTSSYTMGGGYFPAEEIQGIMAQHHKKCHELKHKFTEKCSGIKDLNFKVLVESSTEHKPGHGVVQRAEELGVDMIVIGTCGHGFLRRTVLGSVSDCVIHHSKIPVMVCHK